MADMKLFFDHSNLVSAQSADELDYEFGVVSSLKACPSPEPFRKRIEGVQAKVNWDGLETDADVIDIGEREASLIVDFGIPVNELVTITINCNLGFIEVLGKIMSASALPSDPSQTKLTCQIQPNSRIEGAKWNQFLTHSTPF
jgi:hypothetical protein